MFRGVQIIICILIILACTAMTGGLFLVVAATVIVFLLIGYIALKGLAKKNGRNM